MENKSINYWNSFRKPKNQKDRARVVSQHPLLRLKNVQLELAVSEGRYCENKWTRKRNSHMLEVLKCN